MTRARTLSFFVGIFILISVLFVWSYSFDLSTRFLAGTNPPRPAPPAVIPQLPPLRTTDPARGGTGPDAITIVEFSDFTCPSCRATETEIIKLFQELGPRVRLVWRDIPLGQESPETILATLAARCAKDQGKFWEMHDLLFQSQTFNVESMNRLASKAGLNGTAFSACLSSLPQLQQIQEDLRIADGYNIKTTPVFFIGREVLSGYIQKNQFKASIERAVFKK